MRFQAAVVASLNLFCICCTQSRPVTIIRAIIKGSVSLRLSSNSFRASSFNILFQGFWLFSSAQWKCLAVRKISLYNDKASVRLVWSVMCLRGDWLAEPGIQSFGGMVVRTEELLVFTNGVLYPPQPAVQYFVVLHTSSTVVLY